MTHTANESIDNQHLRKQQDQEQPSHMVADRPNAYRYVNCKEDADQPSQSDMSGVNASVNSERHVKKQDQQPQRISANSIDKTSFSIPSIPHANQDNYSCQSFLERSYIKNIGAQEFQEHQEASNNSLLLLKSMADQIPSAKKKDQQDQDVFTYPSDCTCTEKGSKQDLAIGLNNQQALLRSSVPARQDGRVSGLQVLQTSLQKTNQAEPNPNIQIQPTMNKLRNLQRPVAITSSDKSRRDDKIYDKLSNELQASPSRIENQSFQDFENLDNLHDQSAATNQLMVQPQNVLGSIFYNNTENSNARLNSQFKIEKHNITINYKHLSFKNMNEANSTNNAVKQRQRYLSLDTIDISQGNEQQLQSNEGNHKSIIFLSLQSSATISSSYVQLRIQCLNNICQKYENEQADQTGIFQTVFNQINEIFINNIIDREQQLITGGQSFNNIDNILLINERQPIMDGQSKSKRSPSAIRQASKPQAVNHRDLSSHRAPDANRGGALKNLHEALYRESDVKRENLLQKQKERQLTVLEQEFVECTFSPQPQNGQQQTQNNNNIGNQAKKNLQCWGGSFDGSQTDGQCPMVRSAQKFYTDMMEYKQNKEKRLNEMREMEENYIRNLSKGLSKQFVSETQKKERFNQLSKEKMHKFSPRLKIDLSDLGSQAQNQAQLTQRTKKTQKLINFLTKKSDQNPNQNTLRARNRSQTKSSKSENKSNGRKSAPNKKLEDPYTTCPNKKLSEQLYNDFFIRRTRSNQLKRKYLSEERIKTNNYGQKQFRKSNIILANKIALKVRNVFEGIMKNQNAPPSESADALVPHDVKIEENRHDDQPKSKQAAKSNIHQSDPNKFSQSSLPDHHHSITYSQYTELMLQMKYCKPSSTNKKNDRPSQLSSSPQKIDQSDEALMNQAWKIIGQNLDSPLQMQVVSLRNLIVFLVGIENIFIESMTRCDGQDMQLQKRRQRQVGYFEGADYYLTDESDTVKLSQIFRALVQNKSHSERDAQQGKCRNQQKENEQIEFNDFRPRINKTSQKLATQKLNDFFRNSLSQSRNSVTASVTGHVQALSSDMQEAQTYESKVGSKSVKGKTGYCYQDFLLTRGRQTQMKKERLAEQILQQEIQGCTFKPQINKPYRNVRSLSNTRGVPGAQYLDFQGCPSGNERQSKEELENSNYQGSKSTIQSKVMQVVNNDKNDIFENLYQRAQIKRDKSQKFQKLAQERQIERIKKECTFRPNLNQTQQINSKLFLKNYIYKHPDALQVNFNQTQQLTGRLDILSSEARNSKGSMRSSCKSTARPKHNQGLNQGKQNVRRIFNEYSRVQTNPSKERQRRHFKTTDYKKEEQESQIININLPKQEQTIQREVSDPRFQDISTLPLTKMKSAEQQAYKSQAPNNEFYTGLSYLSAAPSKEATNRNPSCASGDRSRNAAIVGTTARESVLFRESRTFREGRTSREGRASRDGQSYQQAKIRLSELKEQLREKQECLRREVLEEKKKASGWTSRRSAESNSRR